MILFVKGVPTQEQMDEMTAAYHQSGHMVQVSYLETGHPTAGTGLSMRLDGETDDLEAEAAAWWTQELKQHGFETGLG